MSKYDNVERRFRKAGRTGGVWWTEPCSSWLFVMQGLRAEHQLGGKQFLLALLVTRHDHICIVALSVVLTFECMERCGLAVLNTQLVCLRGKNRNPFLYASFSNLYFPLLSHPWNSYRHMLSVFWKNVCFGDLCFANSLIGLYFFQGEIKTWSRSKFCNSICAYNLCSCWQC